MKIDALLGNNVLISLLVETHEHHPASSRLQLGDPASRFAIAAHSYAEVYSTLTRRAERSPFRFTPEEALAALESVRVLRDGLRPPQDDERGGYLKSFRQSFQ